MLIEDIFGDNQPDERSPEERRASLTTKFQSINLRYNNISAKFDMLYNKAVDDGDISLTNTTGFVLITNRGETRRRNRGYIRETSPHKQRLLKLEQRLAQVQKIHHEVYAQIEDLDRIISYNAS